MAFAKGGVADQNARASTVVYIFKIWFWLGLGLGGMEIKFPLRLTLTFGGDWKLNLPRGGCVK